MKDKTISKNGGFSILELIIAMTIMLVLLGLVSTVFVGAIGSRKRESRRTDALASSQAALNVISREIANSGYGLESNGVVIADSNDKRIHFRSNLVNTDLTTDSPGEDVTYFYDSATESIVRYDPNDEPETSVVVNRISSVLFQYFDYTAANPAGTQTSAPTINTGRVVITVTVELERVEGQPNNQRVTFSSDVTLRNSEFMLRQY